MEAGPAGFERVVLVEPASSGNGVMGRTHTMSSSREHTHLSPLIIIIIIINLLWSAIYSIQKKGG